MHVALGVAEEQPTDVMVGVFSGQLFLDLTRIAQIATHVGGATVDRMCQALCGRTIPEVDPGPMASLVSRGFRAVKYGAYLMTAGARAAHIAVLLEETHWVDHHDALAQWAQLNAALPALNAAFEHHVAGSALSGALVPALLEISAGGKAPTEVDHARVAQLVGDASGVESADIAGAADRLAAIIVASGQGDVFAGADVGAATTWLRHTAPTEVQRSFSAYLARHGHRSVRELELRERPWSDDPEPLVRMLQTSVQGRLAHGARVVQRPVVDIPLALRPLVAMARAAVRYREACKSLLVKFATPFKHGYRHLGALLVRDGVLLEEESVFFLTHAELGKVVHGRAAPHGGWALLARARRAAFAVQSSTVFPSLFRGRPEPVSLESQAGEGRLVGRPVSPGVVEGRACVVRTLAEASALRPGDILVAPITDVGWTPYFAAIAGLVTDLGSAVSHGAVVAREVGLPCVVNTSVGTLTFRTGDRLRLDGTKGTVERVDLV
jgi:pyruvate,water dikinase